MEMHQVRYFMALAETRNFTKAAEKCNVSQPSLTRAIKALEDEVGGILLHRERNNTHLTELGQLLLPHIERAWASAEAAKTTAKSLLSLKDAPLKLGVMCTIGPLRFGGFLNRFHTQHPGVRLSLIERTPSQLSGMLDRGELDVAIMAQPDPFDERFRPEPLYGERFVVAFAPGHRFAQLNAVRMADMDGESYLVRINCEFFERLKEARMASGAELQYAYQSEREDWIQVMALAGLGICFTPAFSPLVPGLMTRPIIEPEVARTVSLVTVAGRRHTAPLAVLVRALKAYRWPESPAAGG
ncbi:MAG TPA: LysR family transcriptional regulator [Methylomirabilota bacterium]|nr:LysR family transcriptional regulator [Methylomirabilota bacterium]